MAARCHAGHGTPRRLEVADSFRIHGEDYRQSHHLSGAQLRVMRDIEACRTARLGGHLMQCDHCGVQVVRYRSCGNRHCPKCQTLTQVRWVEARLQDLLPVPYFHCVFTLPHELNPLAQGNPRCLYGLLFQSASQTLQTFGRDPKRLGGELGMTMVLHTWSQTLEHHIHVDCVVTGGALASHPERWIVTRQPNFLFPVKALAKLFRIKYLKGLEQAYERGDLGFGGQTTPLSEAKAFKSFVRTLQKQDWVVYAKPPFGSPNKVIDYLGRYTHRVAISHHRLVAFEQGQISFRWRDSRDCHRIKVMTLDASEFIRRFLLHTIPTGFMRIRHYSLLGNRCRRSKLATCRGLLDHPEPLPKPAEEAAALMRRLTGIDIERCPHCKKGRLEVMITIHPLSAMIEDSSVSVGAANA